LDYLSAGNEANISGLEIELVKGSITDLDFRIAQSEYATRSVLQFRSKMRMNHCNIPKVVSAFRELGVKNIEIHIHDDFGLSVSSALAGFWYGANWSSLTFLGIGERSGNTELEKILLFLIRRVGGFEKYDLSCMVRFVEYMEHHIGIRIPRNKSIVDRNVFVHESGIHTAGVIKNPFTYEPYPPEIIGAERQLLIGDSSGREVVRHKVEEALHELIQVQVSIEKNDPRIAEIQKDIQRLYDEEERVSCISDEELTRYVEKYFMLAMIVDGEEVRDIVEE